VTVFPRSFRDQALSRLDETFDLIVVGGGVIGAGILMDSSLRGLRAILIEKDDIASGTSSRSSKLIHGGLRYLKHMQFGITRLACQERDRLLALNADLVRPTRFLYPAREDDKVPGWTVDLGLFVYDRLTERPDKHAHPSSEDVARMAPLLDVSRLERALAYDDAVADDARLTLAIAATGFAHGGLVLPRAEVLEAIRGLDGRIGGVVLRDEETGRSHRVLAAVVVNATGVWVDALRDRFGIEGRKVRPSRGSHVILERARLPLEAAVAIPSPDDARPVFLVPHPEGILVGTTDLYHDGDLDDPRVTKEEVSYLLRAVQSSFPAAGIRDTDVVGAFAGLRPILDAHAETPSEASREEDLWEEDGLLSVAGGKLTTWRSTAEEVVDHVLELLSDERASRAFPCATEGTPLAGAAPPDLSRRLEDAHGLEEGVALGMARRLRAAAWLAPELAQSAKELKPVLDGTDLTAAELRAHLRFGAVLRLEDVLLRRARLGMWTPELARELAPRLRSIASKELAWEGRRWRVELDRFERAIEGWTTRGVL
jgi:glycerol-3-phosphate dehydrogenase